MSSVGVPTSLSPQGHCRVLCIDDDPAMQRIFVGALARPGFAVEVVCNGQEALDLFLSQPDRIDLLVVDHRMPGMSGRELVAALRGHGFGGPVLVVSAALAPRDYAEYRALGVEQFLAKPITAAALRAAVGEASRLPSP